MARKYANIITAMWRSDEWRALDGEEQRVYMLLNTQPDISAAGVLHLSVTRWSAMARNTPPEAIVAAIEGLARARFVVYDTRTEELLVRSFVRWDGGHTNSKRRPVIRDAAQEVLSPTIRRALALEFRRLGLPGDWLPDALSDTPSHTTPETPPDEEPKEIADGLFALGNRVSDRASDAISPSERVVVTKGPYLLPQPTTHNPQPPASLSANADPPPKPPAETLTTNQRARLITNAYAEAEPMCKWPAINGIVIKAIQTGQHADDAIREALLRLAKEGRTVTIDTLRVELRGFPPTRRPNLVEHDGLLLKPETVTHLERRKRFEAIDAANTQKAIGGTQ